MASGGARKGAGAKPNQHRIANGELRRALEAKLGMPYHEMLAETQLKLFTDFRNDKNIKEYVRFTEHMSSRILENQDSTVNINDSSLLTPEERQAKINNLLTRKALSEAGPSNVPTSTDQNIEDTVTNTQSKSK